MPRFSAYQGCCFEKVASVNTSLFKTSSSEMVYCPHCGKALQQAWKFCMSCGESVELKEPTSPKPASSKVGIVPASSWKMPTDRSADDATGVLISTAVHLGEVLSLSGNQQYYCVPCRTMVSGNKTLATHLFADTHRARAVPKLASNMFGEGSNPGPWTDWFDPEKYSFHYHGNWGGPGFGAGAYTQDPDWSFPATDELDETFKEHDYDYTRMPHREADMIWLSKVEKLLNSPARYTVQAQLAAIGFVLKNASRVRDVPMPDYPWKFDSSMGYPGEGPPKHRHLRGEDPTTHHSDASHHYHDGPYDYSREVAADRDRRKHNDNMAGWSDDTFAWNDNAYHEYRDFEDWQNEDERQRARDDQKRYDDDYNHSRPGGTDVHDEKSKPIGPPASLDPTKKVERIGEASNPGPDGDKMSAGSNSVPTGCRFGEPITVQHTGDGVIVSGTDYLGPLPAPNETPGATWTTGVVLYNQPLGVNFGGILSRVTRFAKMYEMFKVLIFEVQSDPDLSSAPTASGGASVTVPTLVAWVDPDVTDDPASNSGSPAVVQNGINQRGAVIAKAFEPWRISGVYDSVNSGWLWCNADATSTDPHFRFFGRTIIACGNTIATTFNGTHCCTLYLKWKVQFKTPTGINTIPNMGYGYNTSSTMTGLDLMGATTSDQFWDNGLEMTPYMEYDTATTETRLYPLQVFNPLSGDTYLEYAPCQSQWVVEVDAEGTHFRAGDGTVGTGGTLVVDATTFTGYGVSILDSNDPTYFCSFANAVDSVSKHEHSDEPLVSGQGTKAHARFVMTIPVNCDTNAFIGLKFPTNTTAVTVTKVSIRLNNIPVLSLVSRLVNPTMYVKHLDGSIDFAATAHEKHKQSQVDVPLDEQTSCPCSYCVSGKPLPKGEVDPYDEKKMDTAPSTPVPMVGLMSSSSPTTSHNSWTTVSRKPLKLCSDVVIHKKFSRIGEAKNPGPDQPVFRGDQVKLHQCGHGLQLMPDGAPPRVVPLKSLRPTRAQAAVQVVTLAPKVKQYSLATPIICRKCGVPGHKSPDCTNVVTRRQLPSGQKPAVKFSNKPLIKPVCNFCGRVGHMANKCNMKQQVAQMVKVKTPVFKPRSTPGPVWRAGAKVKSKPVQNSKRKRRGRPAK